MHVLFLRSLYVPVQMLHARTALLPITIAPPPVALPSLCINTNYCGSTLCSQCIEGFAGTAVMFCLLATCLPHLHCNRLVTLGEVSTPPGLLYVL